MLDVTRPMLGRRKQRIVTCASPLAISAGEWAPALRRCRARVRRGVRPHGLRSSDAEPANNTVANFWNLDTCSTKSIETLIYFNLIKSLFGPAD